MGKILMVATVDRHIAAFHRPYIELLTNMGHTVDVASRITGDVPPISGVRNQFDLAVERQPFRISNVRAYHQLKEIINKGNYDLLHCHTPVASVLSRLAATGARKHGLKVMYTAHGFHFFKGAPLLNWILYYPIERIMAKKTDILVTINHEDYDRARTFKTESVVYIPGIGVQTCEYIEHITDKKSVRKAMNIPDNSILLFSVGEVNHNKNHEIIIRAVSRLRNSSVHYAVAGSGPLIDNLRQLSANLGISNNIHFLGFRGDVKDLYKASDIFCFPSRREGLGLAAIEAMASGLPLLASGIHGIRDYLVDGVDGYAVKPTDLDDITSKLKRLITDEALRLSMGKEGQLISQHYDLSIVLEIMGRIYAGVLQ